MPANRMRVVMVGNCQIQSLAKLYKRFARVSFDQDIAYVPAYEEMSDADARLVEAADLLVEQVTDFAQKAEAGAAGGAKPRIGVPLAGCPFLWPYAGQEHPRNPLRPFLPRGPYPATYSDSYLNRLIEDGVSPAEALEHYLAHDVAEAVNLDRWHKFLMERQRIRDEKTGFQIAPVIEEHFRREHVFLAPFHPNLRVALELAAQFFDKMGVDAQDTARMRRAVRITPFPLEELPVHPSVARHFGLEWATEDRRYLFAPEGSFSFPQFVQRYMACAWNEGLFEGIAAAEAGDLPRAISLLNPALARSPDSAKGQDCLRRALEWEGRLDEAVQAGRRAVELAPGDAFIHANLGQLLIKCGSGDEGERLLRHAADLDPCNAHAAVALAKRLAHLGRHGESMELARQALTHSPYETDLHIALGNALHALGDEAQALASFRAAMVFASADPAQALALANVLERAGQRQDAAALLHAALARAPHDFGLNLRLAVLLDRDAAGESTPLWAKARHLAGEDFLRLARLSEAMRQAGRIGEAEIVARHCLAKAEDGHDSQGSHQGTPSSRAALLSRRADLLLGLGRMEDAARAYRDAIAVFPGSAHLHGKLARVLALLDQHEAAIDARKAALSRDPGNVKRRIDLGQAYLAAGRLDEAEAAFRTALAQAPRAAGLHASLAQVLRRAHRPAEAAECLRQAVALEPGRTSFALELGQLLEEARDFRQARSVYLGVTAREPDHEQASLRLARVERKLGAAPQAREAIAAGGI
jgi:tetratricopeptide (TPR) repeat protein